MPHRLAIAFERIARDRRAQKQQIVEMRQLALRAATADVIDAGRGGAPDFGQRIIVEGRRKARRSCVGVCQSLINRPVTSALSTWKW